MSKIHIGKEITVINIEELADPYDGMKALADELKQSLGDLNNTVCQIEGALLSGLMNDIGIADEEVSQFKSTLAGADQDFKDFLAKVEAFEIHPISITIPPPQYYYVSGNGQGGMSVTQFGQSATPMSILGGANTGRELMGLGTKGAMSTSEELLGAGTEGLGFLLAGASVINSDKGSIGNIESEVQTKLTGKESDYERLQIERNNIENLAILQGQSFFQYHKDALMGVWNNITNQPEKQQARTDREYLDSREFILANSPNISDKDKLALYNQMEGQPEFSLPKSVDINNEGNLKGAIKGDKGSIADDLSSNWKGGLGLFDLSKNPDDHIITELRMKILAEEQALEKLKAGKAQPQNGGKAQNSPPSTGSSSGGIHSNNSPTSSSGGYSSSLGDIKANSIHTNLLYANSMHTTATGASKNTASSSSGGASSISINAVPATSQTSSSSSYSAGASANSIPSASQISHTAVGSQSGGKGNVTYQLNTNFNNTNHTNTSPSRNDIHNQVVHILTDAIADSRIGIDTH